MVVDGDWNRLTDLAPTGEVPAVRKASALVGFDRMNAARIAIQHDALVVGLFDQRETLPVGSQAGEASDELGFGESEKRGDARDFRVLQADVAGPFAACRAALADVVNAGIELDVGIARAAVVSKHG